MVDYQAYILQHKAIKISSLKLLELCRRSAKKGIWVACFVQVNPVRKFLIFPFAFQDRKPRFRFPIPLHGKGNVNAIVLNAISML
jgi:hypothetical protein